MKTYFILFLTFFLFSNYSTAKYPTVWSIKNTSDTTHKIACECSPKGVDEKINFSTNIHASSTKTHIWKKYHNDYLGLNACSWTCSLDDGKEKLGFATNWGDEVELSVDSTGHLISTVTSEKKK